MKVYFATDHAGFDLKNVLLEFVSDELQLEVEDLGAYEYDENDDYPDFIVRAGEALRTSPEDRAIILGGSGQGEAMVANRFAGVRAAVYYGGPLDIISLSREHNDANVLSIGARFVDPEEAKEAVRLWLESEFNGEERHQRRINKLESL